MSEPLEYIFYCSKEDYPRFRELMPDHPLFRGDYEKFLRMTNERMRLTAPHQNQETVTVPFEKVKELYEEKREAFDQWLLDTAVFRVAGAK